MHLVYTKSVSYDTRDVIVEARIPSMYFVAQPDFFQNTRIYIPADYFTTNKKVLTVSLDWRGKEKYGSEGFNFVILFRIGSSSNRQLQWRQR